MDDVERLLPLRTIAIREFAPEYFELDMKGYNRADLLSLRGVAYEVGAITDSPITFGEPDDKDFIWSEKNLPQAKTEVKNQSLAPLYCIAKIEGLKVEKSSPEWVKKLTESGMRSVNNIADVTNLVMIEYGQPLHAFDASTVKNEEIIVRTATAGEKLTTLDGKVRKLVEGEDLLITDSEKALGLAGVMGGKESEITDNTEAVLLEAAIFDPKTLRKTATRLNLNSEASKRFEHGLTRKRCLQALDAAIRMYEGLGGKLVSISIMGDFADPVRKIEIHLDKIISLIGIEITPQFIEETLSKLYFTVEKLGQGKWLITPPYFRQDIIVEEDVIEEIARIYGYEKIPAKELSGELPTEINQRLFNFIYDLKKQLVELGMTEVQTYSFFSTSIISNLEMEKKDLIRVGNPMSSETAVLRDNLWPSLLEVAAKNLKTRDDLAIFEVGKVYIPQGNALPQEEFRLSMAVSSQITTSIQELFAIFLKASTNLGLKFDMEKEDHVELFHPVRFAWIKSSREDQGFIGEVHPRIVNRFGVEKRIAVLEIAIKG